MSIAAENVREHNVPMQPVNPLCIDLAAANVDQRDARLDPRFRGVKRRLYVRMNGFVERVWSSSLW
jgi:hypothetical protein